MLQYQVASIRQWYMCRRHGLARARPLCRQPLPLPRGPVYLHWTARLAAGAQTAEAGRDRVSCLQAALRLPPASVTKLPLKLHMVHDAQTVGGAVASASLWPAV